MNKKIFSILVMLLFLFSISITINANVTTKKLENEIINSYDRPHVTIYINTSGIESRTDLTESQKTALINLILAHVRANYNDAVGAANVTITNDSDEEEDADRTVEILNEYSSPTHSAWGRWFAGDHNPGEDGKKSKVFLREFMDFMGHLFKYDNGTWNLTALSNALGHTTGHEVGHSYSCAHDHETATSGPDGTENRSKMTDGNNIPSSERSEARFLFSDADKEILRRNWGNRPCNASELEDRQVTSEFTEGPSSGEMPDEYGTNDATMSVYSEMPGWYELGFLGYDNDNGAEDGDPDYDFIYKSTIGLSTDKSIMSFLSGHHDATTWMIRGTDISPYPGEWFFLDPENIYLEDPIENPDGDVVYREISMIWPEHGVYVNLDSQSYGSISCPYNGFLFELFDKEIFLSEDFESGIPDDWTVVDFGNDQHSWRDDNPANREAEGSCYNKFLICDSDFEGPGVHLKEEIWAPSLDLRNAEAVYLDFSHSYMHYVDNYGSVDISIDGGNNWANIEFFDYSVGRRTSIDITDYAAGQDDVIIRWLFDDADEWAFYWMIDDVKIYGIQNQEPSKPMITGPAGGKPGKSYNFVFNAVDPNGDDVRYIIDWGDGNTDTTNYYSSGTDTVVSHSWNEKRVYLITANAEDREGLIGPKNTKTINIPRNRVIINSHLQNILEKYPNILTILKHIINSIGVN